MKYVCKNSYPQRTMFRKTSKLWPQLSESPHKNRSCQGWIACYCVYCSIYLAFVNIYRTGIASALTVTDTVFMQRFRLLWPLFPLWRKEQSILRIYITNFPLSYTYCKMKLYLQEGYEPTVTIRFTA